MAPLIALSWSFLQSGERTGFGRITAMALAPTHRALVGWMASGRSWRSFGRFEKICWSKVGESSILPKFQEKNIWKHICKFESWPIIDYSWMKNGRKGEWDDGEYHGIFFVIEVGFLLVRGNEEITTVDWAYILLQKNGSNIRLPCPTPALLLGSTAHPVTEIPYALQKMEENLVTGILGDSVDPNPSIVPWIPFCPNNRRTLFFASPIGRQHLKSKASIGHCWFF